MRVWAQGLALGVGFWVLLRFRLWGLGLRFWVLGFGGWGKGLGFVVWGFGLVFRVQRLRLRVKSLPPLGTCAHKRPGLKFRV